MADKKKVPPTIFVGADQAKDVNNSSLNSSHTTLAKTCEYMFDNDYNEDCDGEDVVEIAEYKLVRVFKVKQAEPKFTEV